MLETSPRTVKRGLRTLRGRLVDVTPTGHKSSWAVEEVPDDPIDSRSLRGPIPWAWWAAASRLPNPSLRVGAVCWIISGRERSAEFNLGMDRWAELGLSRFAITRGLRELERVDLISVSRRSGRSPVVSIHAN